MVALFQRLLRQSVPTFRTVDDLCSLERNIQVTAFDSEIKPGILVLNEV